jgi:N6-L-threonylcarbamoyladenine synthase
VVDQLVAKLERALRAGDWSAVALGGGVAANGLLRRRVEELCGAEGVRLKLVSPELCTDNAAMIASAARFVEPTPYPRYLDFDAFATGEKAVSARLDKRALTGAEREHGV